MEELERLMLLLDNLEKSKYIQGRCESATGDSLFKKTDFYASEIRVEINNIIHKLIDNQE